MAKSTILRTRQGEKLYPKTTASVTFMDDGVSVEAEILDLKSKTQYFKGHFISEEALTYEYPDNIENPEIRTGWYCIVGTTDTIWVWDVQDNMWENSGSEGSSGVQSVNGLDGEVILTGEDINATATRDTTSVTKKITGHLNDIYSELEETVTTDTDQVIAGTKTFTNVIGLLNEDAGQVDQIKHINNNFLITSGTGKNLLNIDEGLETISAFNRQLAFEDEITQIQGDYATKAELNQESQRITNIETLIPSQATISNKLADKDFVNSSINSVTAYYITKNAQGDPFATKAELTGATVYYSGGQVRTPTKNDYAIVLADETKDNGTTRYLYYNQWEFQYKINESPLTSEQLYAINSGITSSLVSKISSNELMLNSLSEQVATDYATKQYVNTAITNAITSAIEGDY